MTVLGIYQEEPQNESSNVTLSEVPRRDGPGFRIRRYPRGQVGESMVRRAAAEVFLERGEVVQGKADSNWYIPLQFLRLPRILRS